MSIRQVVIALGVGAAATATACTRDRDQPFRDVFEPVAARYMEDMDIPGLAVVVANRGGVVYRYERGVQSRTQASEVTQHSLFHAASLTKTFTATAVMRLVESGDLDLDDTVARYLPYFGPATSPSAHVTVRQQKATRGHPRR